MDDVTIWFIVTGALFIAMALASSLVARVPLTPSVLYVGVGILLGPHVSGLPQSTLLITRARWSD